MGNTGRFEWRNILEIFVHPPFREMLHSASSTSRLILQEPRDCSGVQVHHRILGWPWWEGSSKLLWSPLQVLSTGAMGTCICRLQWDFH